MNFPHRLSLKIEKSYRLVTWYAWNFGIDSRERERERKDRCPSPRNYPSAVCNSMTGIGSVHWRHDDTSPFQIVLGRFESVDTLVSPRRIFEAKMRLSLANSIARFSSTFLQTKIREEFEMKRIVKYIFMISRFAADLINVDFRAIVNW